MQSDRFTTAEIWLLNAQADQSVTKELSERLPSVACFHAQQAAEKALKALLVVVAGDVARTAELGRALDRFYMTTRSPMRWQEQIL